MKISELQKRLESLILAEGDLPGPTVLAAMFPGRQPDELTPAEWTAMRDEGPGQIIPF